MNCQSLDSQQGKQLTACLTAISKQSDFIWLVTMIQSLKCTPFNTRKKIEVKQYGS